MTNNLYMCECGEPTLNPLRVCSFCKSFDGLCQSPVGYVAPKGFEGLVPCTDKALIARVQQVRNSVETIREADAALKQRVVSEPVAVTSQSKELMRAEFEAWLRERWPDAVRPIDAKTDNGFYMFAENNLLWEVWQAAALRTLNGDK